MADSGENTSENTDTKMQKMQLTNKWKLQYEDRLLSVPIHVTGEHLPLSYKPRSSFLQPHFFGFALILYFRSAFHSH